MAEILQQSENIYYEFVRNLELLRSLAYFFRTFLPNVQTTDTFCVYCKVFRREVLSRSVVQKLAVFFFVAIRTGEDKSFK